MGLYHLYELGDHEVLGIAIRPFESVEDFVIETPVGIDPNSDLSVRIESD